jgi:hypothetical protein
MPFVDVLIKIIRQIICQKKCRKKFGEKFFERENISKKSAEKKSKNPLNVGGKSQNPVKNCRDFLIPKILVRFFQSNLPLASCYPLEYQFL